MAAAVKTPRLLELAEMKSRLEVIAHASADFRDSMHSAKNLVSTASGHGDRVSSLFGAHAAALTGLQRFGASVAREPEVIAFIIELGHDGAWLGKGLKIVKGVQFELARMVKTPGKRADIIRDSRAVLRDIERAINFTELLARLTRKASEAE